MTDTALPCAVCGHSEDAPDHNWPTWVTFHQYRPVSPEAAPPRAKSRDVCWLIERGQPERQAPTVWWTGTEWSPVALLAQRFPTREAADAEITARSGYVGDRFGRASEHVFATDVWANDLNDRYPDHAPPRATTLEPIKLDDATRDQIAHARLFALANGHASREQEVQELVRIGVLTPVRASLAAAPSEEIGGLREAFEAAWKSVWDDIRGTDESEQWADFVQRIDDADKASRALIARASVDAREAERLRAAAAALVTHHDTYGVIPSGLIDTLRASLPTTTPESNK